MVESNENLEKTRGPSAPFSEYQRGDHGVLTFFPANIPAKPGELTAYPSHRSTKRPSLGHSFSGPHLD